jgi:hypothetical protein
MIIGLTGKARSGKDTAAAYLAENSFEHYWFSKPMKDACRAIFGWDDGHLYGDLKEAVDTRFGCSPRQALQTLGTEWGRECIGENLWVDIAKDRMIKADNIVISDVRFDNEARVIREMGGVIVNISRNDAHSVNAHSSEQGIDNNLINMHIANNGTIEHLHKEIEYIFLNKSY